MVVGFKDAAKLLGISVIACCAVFVCTLFLNFNMDIVGVKDQIQNPKIMGFYEAQVMSAKMISAVSGGCLLLTSVVMLLFYIKHYIDTHRKELGILKALGYSNFKIASGFWRFGLSIFAGTAVGFSGSFFLMPTFYHVMNEDKILPDIAVGFHPVLALFLVVLPSVFFSLLAVVYGCLKLKCPVLLLLAGKRQQVFRTVKQKQNRREMTFLEELRRTTARSRKSLIFFIAFASFCFSSMIQMSFSMDELASVMFAVMIVLIGIILSCTTLFLAITTVVNANTKTIAMMRVFGYSMKDCGGAILGGYRPVAYVGFAVGTLYQYGLLRLMVSVIFKDVENVPTYSFDFPAMFMTLILFIAIYESIMYVYTLRIRNISLKEIMLE